jgi:hypothetical protein
MHLMTTDKLHICPDLTRHVCNSTHEHELATCHVSMCWHHYALYKDDTHPIPLLPAEEVAQA